MRFKYQHHSKCSSCSSRKYRRKKNKVCFAPWHGDNCLGYWQSGFGRLHKSKYKCIVKRKRGEDLRYCRVVECGEHCVVLEAWDGERIVVCFDEISSVELDWNCCHDWDWDNIFYLFD